MSESIIDIRAVTSIISKLGNDPKYANSKDEYQVQFVPTTASAVQSESNEILTKTVVVQFIPKGATRRIDVVPAPGNCPF